MRHNGTNAECFQLLQDLLCFVTSRHIETDVVDTFARFAEHVQVFDSLKLSNTNQLPVTFLFYIRTLPLEIAHAARFHCAAFLASSQDSSQLWGDRIFASGP